MTLGALNSGTCPECGGTDFQIGPRGGLAANVRCYGCGARFWLSPPFPPRRIDNDHRLYADSPVVDLATWIRGGDS